MGYKNGNQDDGRSVTLTTFPMLSYFDVKKDIKSLIYMRTKYQHEPCGKRCRSDKQPDRRDGKTQGYINLALHKELL